MRHDCAFGAAGRSRRIGLERLRVVRDFRRIDRGSRFGYFVLERQKALRALIKDETQRRTPRDRQRIAMARRVHDRKRAGRVRNDLLERGCRKPRVEREGDRAGAHRAEEELDEFRAVSDHHGDALTGRYAEPSQHARDAIHPLVELPIGRASLLSAEQVDDRDLLR